MAPRGLASDHCSHAGAHGGNGRAGGVPDGGIARVALTVTGAVGTLICRVGGGSRAVTPPTAPPAPARPLFGSDRPQATVVAGSKVSHVSPNTVRSVEPVGGAAAPPNST